MLVRRAFLRKERLEEDGPGRRSADPRGRRRPARARHPRRPLSAASQRDAAPGSARRRDVAVRCAEAAPVTRTTRIPATGRWRMPLPSPTES